MFTLVDSLIDFELFFFPKIDSNSGSTTTTTMMVPHMYLVITTGIWMNKTSNRPNVRTAGSAQNVPFGVLGIMLPYKIVRSTHFSNLCVGKFHFCFSFKININKKKLSFSQAKMDTGICYIIDENGYIMFISQPEGQDRTVSKNVAL